jgi:hypothetical protein
MKECNSCGKQKRISGVDPEFYARSASNDGFQGCCKECSRLKSAEQVSAKRARKCAKKNKTATRAAAEA